MSVTVRKAVDGISTRLGVLLVTCALVRPQIEETRFGVDATLFTPGDVSSGLKMRDASLKRCLTTALNSRGDGDRVALARGSTVPLRKGSRSEDGMVAE
jgi:hypothetical protein